MTDLTKIKQDAVEAKNLATTVFFVESILLDNIADYVLTLADEVERLRGADTGMGELYESLRYRQIHNFVQQMGGWANARHWLNEHGANYFQTCDRLKKALKKHTDLLETVKSLDGDLVIRVNKIPKTGVVAEVEMVIDIEEFEEINEQILKGG